MQSLKEEFDMPESMDDKFILSNNMEYITGYLMREVTDTERQACKEKEEPEKDEPDFERWYIKAKVVSIIRTD